jgi:uncharacterized membrane protein (DUF373 family)
MSDFTSEALVVTIKQENLQKLFEGFGKVILSLLLFSCFCILIAETLRMVLEFLTVWKNSLLLSLQTVIVDGLTLLALFEIYLTLLMYFKENRVKVTYVIDSVFIVMLSELMKQWFNHSLDFQNISLIISILLVLSIIRFLSVRYSPSKEIESRKA